MSFRFIFRVPLWLILAILSSCAGGRFTVAGDSRTNADIPLFYITDRQVNDSLNTENYFGSRRGNLCYGRVLLEPALNYKQDTGVRAKYRYMKLVSVSPAGEEGFFQLLQHEKTRLGDTTVIYLTVHGFNESFSESCKRSAQIPFELEVPGIFIVYSWPSRGSLSGYLPDLTQAEWTTHHLVSVLEALLTRYPDRQVHLIAHSLGGNVLSKALKDAVNRMDSGTKVLLHGVTLLAPDMDRDLFFEDYLPFYQAVSPVTRVYASDKDKALSASRKIRGNYPRLGDIFVSVPAVDRVDFIDATPIGSFWGIGHSSYLQSSGAAFLYFHLRCTVPMVCMEQAGILDKTISGYWLLQKDFSMGNLDKHRVLTCGNRTPEER